MSNVELINGDSLNVLMNGEIGRVDLIVADPPYVVSTDGGGGSINKIKKLKNSLQDLKKKQDITNGYDIDGFAKIVKYLQGNEIAAYFWCNKAQIPEYMRVYVGEYGCKFEILCWHKVNALPTYSNKYLSDTEYCLYFYKGKGKTAPKSYEDAKTFWVEPINHKDKKKYGHPTIKPLHMIEKLIRNSSKEGAVVLGPFMGSGTTAIACMHTNRDFIGIEINEEYFNIAKNRLAEFQINQTIF